MDLGQNTHITESDDKLNAPIKVLKINPKSVYTTEEAHRHNYNEIFFFKNGGGKHLIDFVTYPIKANSVYAVVANKVHFVNRAIESFGYVLMIKNDFFQHEILKTNYAFLVECEEINLKPEAFDEQLELVKEMEFELNSNNLNKADIVVALVHLMLLKLKRSVQANQHQLAENSLYKSFYTLMENHFIEERATHFYADQLKLSSSVLNRELKKATGKTANKLIQKRLLLEAKRLLFHSDLSVKEIGVTLNFTDSAHFSNFFTKLVNSSPSVYRKNVKMYK
ncbi:MAG: helix-turn-helix domain-containing protein [Crocinitomicaceae bacterium]